MPESPLCQGRDGVDMECDVCGEKGLVRRKDALAFGGVTFFLGCVAAGLILTGREIPLKCFDAGNVADWVAALAGCIAAGAAIAIGVNAARFTRDAELKREEDRANEILRDEANVAFQRADLEALRKREQDAHKAKLRVMRNNAVKMLGPMVALKHVYQRVAQVEALENAGRGDTALAQACKLYLTLENVKISIHIGVRTLNSITWSDDFRAALTQHAIDVLQVAEMHQQRFMIMVELFEKSVLESTTPLDARTNVHLAHVRDSAFTLGKSAQELQGLIETHQREL